MYEKITLPALINLLSGKTGKSKKLCEDFLREFFGTLVSTLGDGENIKIKGIGTFKVVEVEPRKSVNVNTGEEMEIPGHRKISFIPAKELAEDVNSPFAMFESVEINDDASEEVAEDIPDEEKEAEGQTIASVYTLPEPPGAISEGPIEELEDESDTSDVNTQVIEEESSVQEVDPSKETISETPQEEPLILQQHEGDTPEAEVETSEPAEEINEEFPTYIDEEEEYSKNRRLNFLWGFLCGLFCTAIVATCCYLFFADKFNAMTGLSKNKEAAIAAPALREGEKPSTPVDCINLISDSVKNVSKEKIESEHKELTQTEVAPTKPSDEIVHDTISKTRYLTTMAKVHYGNYNLWPIIYEENKAILGHPDRIRPGTRVVIPPLSKYSVDPNNPSDIEKYKKKGVEIYARFK